MGQAPEKPSLLASYLEVLQPRNSEDVSIMLAGDAASFPARPIKSGSIEYFVPEDALQGGDPLVARLARASHTRRLRVISLLSFVHGPGIMFDIGGNIGTTSIPRALLHAFDHIHVFEPEPRNFACLQHGIEINAVGDRMTAWRLAVGEKPQTGWLRISAGMGRHDIRRDHTKEGDVACEVTSLDHWLESNRVNPSRIRFVKVDVQGHEPMVLRGASKILSLGQAVWQLEAAPQLLKRYGTSGEEFVALLRHNFSWFCDLHAVHEGFRPTRELKPCLNLEGRRFTDLVLFRAA